MIRKFPSKLLGGDFYVKKTVEKSIKMCKN
jgi:hypothetical protein